MVSWDNDGGKEGIDEGVNVVGGAANVKDE
jgi:hypothetical protein